MYIKSKTNIIILLIFFTVSSIFAGELNLIIKNNTNNNLNLNYVDSTDVDKFRTKKINKKKKKIFRFDFTDDYSLELEIKGKNNELITKLQILQDYKIEGNYKNFLPGGGNLADWGVFFSDFTRIKLKKLEANNDSFLLIPDYNAEVKLEIRKKQQKSAEKNNVPIEFTLFALSKYPHFKKFQINETDPSDIKFKSEVKRSKTFLEKFTTDPNTIKLDKKIKLDDWGLNIEEKIKAATYNEENNLRTRWVDLIIHNYTASTFILYSLKNVPQYDHIEFSYKELGKNKNTVYYPPQIQARGPSFKFSAKTNNVNQIYTYPKTDSPPTKEKDKFYILISKQDESHKKTLHYIPLRIKSSIQKGDSLENGVNLKGYKSYAYKVNFVPINVSFWPTLPQDDDYKNRVRIPREKSGDKEFELKKMKHLKIESLAQNKNNGKTQTKKVGMRYRITGKSKDGKKTYSYKLILIAPPFLCGNSPGEFAPNTSMGETSETANFMRYPLHAYIISETNSGHEKLITGKKTNTELPKDMIGSIEYFVSDHLE